MSSPHPLPPKKEIALALLERSNVHVHLDPRAQGVKVPPWFKDQPQLVLQVGLNMPVPIPDLRLDDEAMSCTLSFNRSPFLCVVPWNCVYAMVGEDGRGMVWPEDVPPELARHTQKPREPRAVEAPTRRTAKASQAPADAKAAKPKKPRKKSSTPKSNRAEGSSRLAVVGEPPAERSVVPFTSRTDDSSRGSHSKPKPKRELPPYLRIVK